MSNKKNVKVERNEKEDFDRWLAYMFTRMNVTAEVPDWLRKKLEAVYRFDRHESFLQKIKKMRRLKKSMIIDPVNYICTVLTARSQKSNISANYGFIYLTDYKSANRISAGIRYSKNPVPVSFCIAPSMMSSDGEYRNRIFQFDQFSTICERYSEIMEAVEKLMAHKIERYELSLDCENFYPQIEHEQLSELLDHFIVEYAVQLKFFAIFWLVEIHYVSINMQENHINPKFNQIFFPHLDDDLRNYRAVVTKFGDRVADMVVNCTATIMRRTSDGVLYTVNHTVGQKLQPLRVLEVEEPLNIYFTPWREMYISALAADLLVNLICPSFAIFIDWFYIKNSKKGLFDNEAQYQKIEFSDRALAITKKLRETQHITYTRDPKTNAPVYLNGMFHTLHDKIDEPVDYVKANLLMSNVTLAFLSENVGRTFIDIPMLCKSRTWVEAVGNVMRDAWVFRKYCWDICYALLCINIKIGVTHSDLHLNNCTINNHDFAITDPKARVIYHVGGAWYALRTHGPHACIIDFSRGTIHPDRVARLTTWPNRSSYDEFVAIQNQGMITKLEETVPTFMKINRTRVVELQRDHFDVFYRIYTAVDSFDFSSRVIKGLGKDLTAESAQLVSRIAKISEHYLTNVLLKAINNSDLEVDWPLMVVLRECFRDEMFDIATPQDWVVTDLWRFDRAETSLPYSLSRFADWPDILKTEYGIPPNGTAIPTSDEKKYRVPSVAHMDARRTRYELYRKDQMKMVNYIAQRHREKYA